MYGFNFVFTTVYYIITAFVLYTIIIMIIAWYSHKSCSTWSWVMTVQGQTRTQSWGKSRQLVSWNTGTLTLTSHYYNGVQLSLTHENGTCHNSLLLTSSLQFCKLDHVSITICLFAHVRPPDRGIRGKL